VRAPLYSTREAELFDAAVIDDPQRLYARLRRELPLSRVGETGVHLVATWDLIEEALQREGDFSANLTGVLMRGEGGSADVFALPPDGVSHVIATADEPEHAVHRALVQPSLTPSRVASLESRLRDWTGEALAPWVRAGGGDFVPVAEAVPARAVARVLGLPDGDVVRHRTWAMMGGDILAGDVTGETLVALARESGRMVDYLGERLDEFAGSAGEDGTSMLAVLAGGVARGEIERNAAVGIAMVMFGAGGESTAALIGSAVRRLAEAPELADRLRAAPVLLTRFIEEVARLESPFKFHYRLVRRDCELGGARLVAGDRLMLLWASANRDPDRFPEPDALRLDRRHPKQHLSFGRDSHFCVGAPLARLEARVVVEELLARTRRIAPVRGERAVYTPSVFVRRLAHLPLAVEPVRERGPGASRT
jgi:cytochrome P450